MNFTHFIALHRVSQQQSRMIPKSDKPVTKFHSLKKDLSVKTRNMPYRVRESNIVHGPSSSIYDLRLNLSWFLECYKMNTSIIDSYY